MDPTIISLFFYVSESIKNKICGMPNTYSVTPAAHMSTLNPENVSKPLAISGG